MTENLQKGSGNKNRSHELSFKHATNLPKKTGLRSNTGKKSEPVACHAQTPIPAFGMSRGPRGPSKVIATGLPVLSACFNAPSASLPPRLEDPRTRLKPRFCKNFAAISPSELKLANKVAGLFP